MVSLPQEVHADANGSAALLANINYGPFVAASSTALARASQLFSATTGSFEARILRISALSLMAPWLKSDSGTGDVLYPLAPAPSGINAAQNYTAEEFMKAILPLARHRMAESDPRMVP